MATSGPVPSRVDPELQEMLATMQVPDLSDLPTARRLVRGRLAHTAPGTPIDPLVSVLSHGVPTVSGHTVELRHYVNTAETGRRGCLVWVHGGGHVLGSIDQDDRAMQEICRDIGCDVVLVALRRAPEHPYPQPLDDVVAAVSWIAHESGRLGIDPARIAIGGASSGGGTAAGAALLTRDRGGPALAFQLLVYPMLDDRNVPPQCADTVDPRVWSGEQNRFAWMSYLGEAFGAEDVPIYAAPSRSVDLTRLPPAFIAVGDLDLFLEEDLDYATRLVRAGVSVEVHVYPGAFHGFVAATGTTVARRFACDRDDALRRALAGPARAAPVDRGRSRHRDVESA